MPRKELKPAMERVNEIKNKAKNESATATMEVPEGWEVEGTIGNVPPKDAIILPDWSEPLARLGNNLQEEIGQNTIRLMQELKSISERIDTIESVLTKLVILSSGKKTEETEAPAEFSPYTEAVEEVKKGLRYINSQGGSRFKFEGAGPSIMGTLVKKGYSIPNSEEFKSVLRGTPGFTYYSMDNSFSYEGE